jgi:superfamily II DNA or RNA helicase
MNNMDMQNEKITLFTWQERCIDVWLSNGCRGIAGVATGAGKTIMALAAAKRIKGSPEFNIKETT